MVTKKELLEKLQELVDLQLKLNSLHKDYLHLLIDATDDLVYEPK